MEHLHLDALIDDLVRGTLPPGERDRIERHLAECSDCRDAWPDIEAALIVLPHGRSIEDPSGRRPAIVAEIRERLEGRVRRHALFPLGGTIGKVLVPLAAGVVVLLFLISLSLDREPPHRLEIFSSLPIADVAEYVSSDRQPIADVAALQSFALEDRDLVRSDSTYVEMTGLEDLDPTALHDIVAEYSVKDVDAMFLRLRERTTL